MHYISSPCLSYPFSVVSFPCPFLAPYTCQLSLVMVVDRKLEIHCVLSFRSLSAGYFVVYYL